MATCSVCGTEYERKRYYDKNGRFKGYGPLEATCSKRCGWVNRRAGWEERFWSRVDRSGGPDACWPWTGRSRHRQGYGTFALEGKVWKAHRLAWKLANGQDPAGEDVRHTCDNPPCCNPAHLVDGSTWENVRDMEQKGRARHPQGEAAGRAVLTEEEVRAIYDDPRGQWDIAIDYGVHQATVWKIKRQRIWRHLWE